MGAGAARRFWKMDKPSLCISQLSGNCDIGSTCGDKEIFVTIIGHRNYIDLRTLLDAFCDMVVKLVYKYLKIEFPARLKALVEQTTVYPLRSIHRGKINFQKK